MRVRLVRKLADRVDGIDLTHCNVGNVIELPEPDGRLIVAERWGVFARRETDMKGHAQTVGSTSQDRRQTTGDIYQRLKEKQEAIERRDRRQLHRRLTDDSSETAPGAP